MQKYIAFIRLKVRWRNIQELVWLSIKLKPFTANAEVAQGINLLLLLRIKWRGFPLKSGTR